MNVPSLVVLNLLACEAVRAPEADSAGDSGAVGETAEDGVPVHISQPRDGNVLSGLRSLRATADDGGGVVTAIDWTVDGVLLLHDEAEPSSVEWNTCPYPPGPYELTASAVDERDGRTGHDTVGIELDQEFEIAFSGFDETLVPGAQLGLWAADDRAIAEVAWSIDGAEVARSGGGEGVPVMDCGAECPELCRRFTAEFDLTSLAKGAHPLEVRVTNAIGETLTERTTLLRGGDTDADGFDGADWGGTDCDDEDATLSPAAPERCDGRDNDCDGEVDEDFDVDGDGYTDSSLCDEGLDCDDADPFVNPDAVEVCDELDNDCDGYFDMSESPEHNGIMASDSLTATVAGQLWGNVYTPAHDVLLTSFDVYVESAETLLFSVYEAGDAGGDFALVASSTVDPTGALEWVGSGALDVELVGGRDYLLGVGSEGAISLRYERSPTLVEAAGLVPGGLTKATTSSRPAALSVTADDNGLMYQTVHVWWIDDENLDVDGDGQNTWCGDCDDGDARTGQGFFESCDGLDNDCDGSVPTDEADDDGDGDRVCDADCDDGDSLRYPSSVELCDGLDNDCDGSTNETDADGDGVLACWDGEAMDCADGDSATLTATRYLDADGDGHGDPATGSADCPFAADTVLEGDDCDDADGATNPDAREGCDGIDNNCDGATDEGFDGDGDGVASCSDCDDTNASIFPGAEPACGDAVDDDCDGVVETCRFEGELGAGDADVIVVGATEREGIGSSVVTGDFDGDGQADLAISAYVGDYNGLSDNGSVSVLSGTLTTQIVGESDSDHFGGAITVADLDQDGLDDLVAGATDDDEGGTDAGAAYVIPWVTATSGPVEGIAFKLVGEEAGADFGGSVATGDVNGDGAVDVLVGSYLADRHATNQGAVWLFLGPIVEDHQAFWADALLEGEQGYDGAGHAVASGGDLTGDGIDDVVVGAHGNGWGALYMLSEPAGSLNLSAADTKISADSAGEYLGYVTPVLVDLDGDGWEDVLAGATVGDGEVPGSGAVFAWYGPFGPARSSADADVTLVGQYAHDFVGDPVVSLDDLDGDGPVDLLLGASGLDAAGSAAGGAYVVYGPVRGTVSLAAADAVFHGEATNDAFGLAAAGGTDLTGDGTPDLLFGAAGSDRGGASSGAVYLFNGPE